jgi:hypothetical protein
MSKNTATASRSAAELWAAVPLNADILVTHTPPYGHCDDSCGCEDLRETLGRVRPRLHVYGHVHQGRGAERLRWDTDGLDARDQVAGCLSVEQWHDPNPEPTSAKISLVDLTGRGGNRPLDFHDSTAFLGARADYGTRVDAPDAARPASCDPSAPAPGGRERVAGLGDTTGRDSDPDSAAEPGMNCSGTGQPDPMMREGRRETCVVNCAILATGWPHPGGKRFNKPIVVDIDLPVWT